MTLWHEIEAQMRSALDRSITLSAPGAVSGGCINHAYRLSSDIGDFFVKLNSASRLSMFQAEAEGLRELGRAQWLRVPQPVCSGLAGGQAFLVMEALDLGGKADHAALGQGLAALHRITADRFGWHRDNTIGSTHQPNDEEDDWVRFWQKHRLGYQLQLAQHKGAGSRVISAGERLLSELPVLFAGHSPQASLLHGDLWSGNYSFTRSGQPAIFDPAVYYGDREADLAMTELFGGFGGAFYSAYENAWPVDEGYRVRKTLYNLYHILNHYNMFGGGYLSQARGMIDALLSELG